MHDQLCFLNGRLLPLKDAKVGVLDLGLLRGFGIYEGLTAHRGIPFRFDDHWNRFEKSAKKLGLLIPFSKDEIEQAMRSLIKGNANDGRANLRLVLTGGEASGGIGHMPGRETLFITAEPYVSIPKDLYEKGATLITHDHERFMPEVKTIHYITAVLLQQKQRAQKAIETLYTSEGRVLECSTSNVFMVRKNVVITPALHILEGVTRKVVLELSRGQYQTEEREIALDEFLSSDEIFITSSFKDIVPIVSVDGQTIGTGAPGPVTRELMDRFKKYTEQI